MRSITLPQLQVSHRDLVELPLQLTGALCRLFREALGTSARVERTVADVATCRIALVDPFPLRLAQIGDDIRIRISLSDVRLSPECSNELSVDTIQRNVVPIDRLHQTAVLVG